jgi:hypothetical protein
MRLKTWGIAAICLMAVGGTAFVATSATAADARAEDPLTVVRGETTFYTELGVESAWAGLVAARTGDLPEGVTYPSVPVDFFYPVLENDEETALFEVGLPDSILDRFARCAWLDQALTATEEENAAVVADATAILDNESLMAAPETAPGTGSYAEVIEAEAAIEGISPEAFEYDVECGMFAEESGK